MLNYIKPLLLFYGPFTQFGESWFLSSDMNRQDCSLDSKVKTIVFRNK